MRGPHQWLSLRSRFRAAIRLQPLSLPGKLHRPKWLQHPEAEKDSVQTGIVASCHHSRWHISSDAAR